jgi:hypothetical protein
MLDWSEMLVRDESAQASRGGKFGLFGFGACDYTTKAYKILQQQRMT